MNRGFAVGVAGIVAFLPARMCSRPTARRVGQLQKFRLMTVDRARNMVVLADPSLHHSSSGDGGSQPRHGSAPKRPPRNVEEAQRRQELARVAEELRSVLALRGDSSSSSSSGSGNSSRAARRRPGSGSTSDAG